MVSTIDAGASGNVMLEGMAMQYPARHPASSRRGLLCTTANGTTMVNKGQKEVAFRTNKGHNRMLNMHFTGVQRPLRSVSRICGSGHRAAFTSEGGLIQHEGTGQATSFYRHHKVYRMEVKLVHRHTAGFT